MKLKTSLRKKRIASRVNTGSNPGALTHSGASKNNLRVELAFMIKIFGECRFAHERIYIVIESAK